MTATVDYYFSFLSPWAYIGHDALHDAIGRQNAELVYKPINVPAAFQASDTPGLAKRHPTRQAYRTLELQRWRVKRGLDFDLWPAHWPFDASTGDKMIIAACENGDDPSGFMRNVFKGIWEKGVDFNVDSNLVTAANTAGLDGATLLTAAQESAVADRYEALTAEAIEVGIFGVPAYIYKGEYFWGQDRIELLEDALSAGRDGYKAVLSGS